MYNSKFLAVKHILDTRMGVDLELISNLIFNSFLICRSDISDK